MYRIFISHADADLQIIAGVARSLTDLGPSCFVASSDIPRSLEWLPRIEEELHNCDALVVFLTPAARASPWVDQEIGYAMGQRKRVVPVRLSPPGMKPHGFLSRLQAVDPPDSALDDSAAASDLAGRIFGALFLEPADRARLVPFVLQGLAQERRIAPLRMWAELLLLARSELDHGQRELVAQSMRNNAALRTDRIAYHTVQTTLPTERERETA